VVEDHGGKQVQRTKEMGAKGRRMGVWIRMHDSTPYLSSQVSGSPSGATLHAHTVCSAYADANKWVYAPLISRRWTTRRWSRGAKTESLCIPYAWSPAGSGIVVMITSGPTISTEQ
jgi:hypothetical protein